MKKLLITFTLLVSFISFSQDKTNQSINIEKGNELKFNMTNLIAFKWFDVTYERILNEESSIGIGTLFTLDSDKDDSNGLDEYRTFSITPYYRHFFSSKYAQGFFIEAFSMIHSGKDEVFVNGDSIVNSSGQYQYKTYTDLAIGISAGAKFVTKRKFIAEFYFGIGRDLLDKSDIEVVGRGGISIGFRF